MSADQSHPPHAHDHPHDRGPSPAHHEPPQTTEDAGSVALADALRSSFLIVRVLLAALLVYFLFSNVHTVGSQERAIILRFGEPVRRGGQVELGPGLVWAFPYPIDEVVRITVTQLQTARSTVGWFAVTPEQEAENIVPPPGPSLNPAAEGYTITGDGNIIHARAIVRYQITEPLKFFLTHTNGAAVMTNIVDNAITFAAAQYSADDALRRDVAGFKEKVLKRVDDLILAYNVGVTREASDVLTYPPRQVKGEFDAVLSAELERSKTVSDAQGYGYRVANEASGQAQARVNAGKTDRNRLIQEVAAEAQRFTSLLPEYQKDPEFFRRRLQTETLQRILTNAQDKFYLPLGPDDELRLQLNREPAAPPSREP